MSFRDRLFKYIFFRSFFTVIGDRSPYAAKATEFTAYFLYKVGDFQEDYTLYFSKQPYLQQYKNEIFNKIYEYTGYDLIRYPEFHYQAFEDKADFIRFLQYEVTERIRQGRPKSHLLNLETTADWLTEKLAAHLEQIVYDTQDKMASLTDKTNKNIEILKPE